MFSVFRFGPQLFLIGFYNRSILRYRQLHANIGINVTVGKMVYNLPHRPAMLTIRFVKSTLTELSDNFFQLFRKTCYLPDLSERIQI